MEMLCPECRGPLEIKDGNTARCTLHGGEYKILFLKGTATVMRNKMSSGGPGLIITQCPQCGSRSEVSAKLTGLATQCKNCQTEYAITPIQPGAKGPITSKPLEAEGTRTCFHHPNKQADFVCSACGVAICATCSFPQEDGTQFCPNCAVQGPGAAAFIQAEQEDMTGVTCVNHPNIQAIHRCKKCGAGVCATCSFALQGNVYLCPECAASPKHELSAKRRGYMVWSYVLAIWCTLGLILLLSGVFAESIRTEDDLMAAGCIISLLIFIPSCIGTGLGFSAFERRLPTPSSVWVAAIWNCVILAIFILMTIIGNFM